MSEALFILIGLVVVGAVIWAGSRQPPDPNASPEDNPYFITDPSRTLFSSDNSPTCDPNDRDGDGIPDSVDAHDDRDDGFFGGSDDSDSSDSSSD
jgi:hypothetical protein